MRVLHIGDLHLPFTHPKYLKFCKQMYKAWDCDTVVFAGDIYEHNAISYHESDPDGLSAGNELLLAEKEVKPWYKAFPEAKVTLGNHDILPFRKAMTMGIPRHMLKDLTDIYGTPNWIYEEEFYIDGVMYHHGKGSGKNAALNMAINERNSVAVGHSHAFGGVQYTASTKDMLFGLNSGCGIDIKRYCFAYGKKFTNRPTLGCGIIIDGEDAYFERMVL